MANPYFNATYYLSNNPDVFAAGINTVEGAWTHYVNHGAGEALSGAASRSPAPWFDISYYLTTNPDLSVAGLTAGQLFDHFVLHGISEGRLPSADANVNKASLDAYAAANEDLRDAFGIEEGEEITDAQYAQLAQHYYQFGYYETRPGKPNESASGETGQTFWLTEGTDRGPDFTGTAGDDEFLAYAYQNPYVGGIGNTLSSADHLDGGAGYDTLFAEIVPEYFGGMGLLQVDVQPRTTRIEQVEFEVRDGASWISVNPDHDDDFDMLATVDAKHMYGVEKIGSKQSDGDLLIENLTTLANDGSTKRNTSELTITMDHTGPENSNDGGSDLTVYFDNNYLIAGQKTEHNIQLRVVNTYQLAENDDPLMGFLSVTFSVGEQEVVVDIAGSATYQDVADAINARLAELGIEGVQASVAVERTAVFTDDVEEYTQGQLAGTYNPVDIVSTNEELIAGPIELESNIKNFDGLNTWVDGDQVTTEDPISVNIELTKVGRGGEGGDLVIGGKAEHHNADQGIAGGIEVFNVIVKGGEHLPNSLGTLTSTNDALHTVYISSEVLLGQQTFASLEIRDGFGQAWWYDQDSLTLVDASDFLGDLTLGSDNRIVDLDTLIATGGGDVDYRGVSRGGHDTSITTGDGDDDIDVGLVGISASGSTPSSAFIDAGNGDNEVEVHSWGPVQHEAIITTGSGVDVIRGNGVSVDVHTGAGNDVIYAENTGGQASGVMPADETSHPSWFFNAGNSSVNYVQLLNGREVTVTLALPNGTSGPVDAEVSGFETTVRVEASNGYLTTERDLYEAVARAINDDPVLSKLAEATVDSKGEFTLQYLVDGDLPAGNPALQVEISGNWEHGISQAARTNIINQLKSDYHDSTITDSIIQTAYNTTIAPGVQQYVGVDVSGGNSGSSGINVVNGGLGDDVIVLSSNANTTDTVEFDAGGFGNDTIVHFTAGDVTGSDVLDFTDWLDNEFSHSGSTESIDRVATTLVSKTGFTANSVVITDFTTLDSAASITLNFDTMTDAQVLAALNNDASFAVVAPTGPHFQGNTQKSILFVENDANRGEYKVFEVTSGITGGTDEFTGVKLVGSLDFGETQSFDVVNFA